jgi:hypothetical protein
MSDDRPSAQQIAKYRAMTPQQRLQLAFSLNDEARQLRLAYERTIHPDWTEAQLATHVKRIFSCATT